MDYSLLLGVYYETEENQAKTAADMKALSENEGVIEYLNASLISCFNSCDRSLMKNDFQQFHNGVKVVRPDGVTGALYIYPPLIALTM